MPSLCIIEQYVLHLVGSLELLRLLIDLRDKLLGVSDWGLLHLTSVIIWCRWEVGLLCPHWVVQPIVHRQVPRITTVWSPVWAAGVSVQSSSCQLDCPFTYVGLKSHILIHLCDLNSLFMPCQSYSLEDLLILNKPLRTADTCSLTIFPVTISMHWWGWFHEDDAVGTNYLTVVFLLIPLGFFDLQLLVFPPLLVTKESIKNRRNFSLMHRYMRGTLDLFLNK
jgi:hypothetical protein